MDKDEFIIDSLKSINAKLEKHDAKFDTIATSLQKLIKVDLDNTVIKEALGRCFKRIELLETEHAKTGCPIGNHRFKDVEEDIIDIESRLKSVENAPMDVAKKIVNSVVAVFGVALGGWLLIKFGFSTESVK